jgi:hypothetical protein
MKTDNELEALAERLADLRRATGSGEGFTKRLREVIGDLAREDLERLAAISKRKAEECRLRTETLGGTARRGQCRSR